MTSRFKEKLRRPTTTNDDSSWAFIILPKDISDLLPRRGRTTVEGTFNDKPFIATLEPDGQLSHWLKVDNDLLESSGAEIGDLVRLEILPVKKEPEPDIPADFQEKLITAPEAMATWEDTTTIARLDWIHWIESSKQAKTRTKRIDDACDMLAAGKRRVCCFDQSGYYSKSLSAPTEADK